LAHLERRTLFGVDVGLETQRGVNTQLNVTPPAPGWLRPRATLVTTFSLARDPNARAAVRTLGDSAGEFRLPTAFSNLQRLDLGASASDLANASAATGAVLPFGFRTSLTYQRTNAVTWVLRGADQVPLRTHSTEWPSGSVSWVFIPPRGSIGRLLQNVSAQLGF